jgi:hypothetical protein
MRLESSVYSALQAGKPLAQAVANQLSGFNIQQFRLVAVGWLIENNHPLSEFEKPAFRAMIALANPLAEDALWSSHNSVARYVMRLYDYLLPLVVRELSQSVTKIHLSLDCNRLGPSQCGVPRWNHRSFFGILGIAGSFSNIALPDIYRLNTSVG